jgi:sporulation protein YtfJ
MEGLMKAILDRIQNMINVNTVVGDPVSTPGGTTIIPISKVCCGFAAGGSEFDFQMLEGKGQGEKHSASSPGSSQSSQQSLPFGGGSGAGVSVKPIGFLVVNDNQVRLLPVEGNIMVERIIEEVPNLIEKFKSFFAK